MIAIRRLYIFLVCAISLQAVTWAVIALLCNLVVASRSPVTTTAWQIAIVVIGLAIFLTHWLWAERLVKELEEREAVLRSLYLYSMLSVFLFSFLINASELVSTWLQVLLNIRAPRFSSPSDPFEIVLCDMITLVVLALLWLYHQRIITRDARVATETSATSALRRLYGFGFSGTGLLLTTLGASLSLRWAMQAIETHFAAQADYLLLSEALSQIIIGLPLWLLFWQQAQRWFHNARADERATEIRPAYLHLIVFIAALTAVANAAIILAGFFRNLLSLPPQGTLHDPLSLLIVMAVVWGYHTRVLRQDIAQVSEAARQANIRRLYNYLVAGVGLATVLIGLSGLVNVSISVTASGTFDRNLKEQLAWFAATLIAGLPVWALPWRRVQPTATRADTAGTHERNSVVRKIYLYFYLFVATMLALVNLVYLLSRLLSIALGERASSNLLRDLAQTLAYVLIAVGVWIYHGWVLRRDNQSSQHERGERLAALRIAIVSIGDQTFGQTLLDRLQRTLPGLTIELVTLTPATIASDHSAIVNRLTQARVIISPPLALSALPAEVAAALATSPARKWLVPVETVGWEWIGAETNLAALLEQATQAVKQTVRGEESPIAHKSSIALGLFIILGLFLVLITILTLIGPAIGGIFGTVD